jgi:hypothetical protein
MMFLETLYWNLHATLLTAVCIEHLIIYLEPGQLSGMALGYEMDDRGFESRQGLRIFLYTTASRPVLGPTQPPVQWVTGALSLGIKRQDREADHSPPSSAEVKNGWSYTSTPQYAFMRSCLFTTQGKRYLSTFTYTFTFEYTRVYPKVSGLTLGARTANGTALCTRCSCIAILWVSLVSFIAITLCVASQRVFIVVSVYFVIDSVQKLLDTPSYLVNNYRNIK